MAVRFYIVPIESVVVGATTYRPPKYFVARNGSGTLTSPWSMYDYGLQSLGLIAADTSVADHNALTAASDVTAIPTPIDDTVPAASLNAVRAKLEALWIPGNWITTAHTYRQVLKVIAGLFQFAQRHHGLHNEALMQGAVNLNLTLGDLSAARRNRIQATSDSFGYNTSSFTLASTLRDVLKFLGDQWGAAEFQFGNITTL